MAGEQEARTTVGYKVDQASVQTAVQANEKVKFSYADMKVAADSVGLSVEELARRTGAEVIGSNQQVAQSNVQVADSYRKVGDEAQKASLTQRASKALGGARQVAGAAGGVLAVAGGGQVGSAVASTLALTQQLGLFGVAAAAGVIVLKGLTDAEDKRAEAAKNAIAALEGTSGATTAELKEQIAAEQARLATLEGGKQTYDDFRERIRNQVALYEQGITGLDEYTTNLRNINAELYDFSNGTLGVKDGLGVAVKNVGDFNGVLDTANTRIATANAAITFLNGTLNTDATAANDAAAASEAFADSLQDGVTKALEDAAKAAEDVEKRFSDARTQQYDAYLEALDIEGKLRDEITETLAKIAEIEAERNAKLIELAEDNRERRAEIEADAAERIQEIAQDSADRIAKILRDAGRDQAAAVGSRDALAFYQSQLRAKDALDDERHSQERQIAQVAKALAKQEQQIQKSYEKQVQQVIDGSNKQIAVQQQTLTRLNVDFANASTARIAIEQNLNSGLQGMAVAHWNAMIGVAYQGGTDMISAFRSAINQGLAAGGLTPIPGGIGGGIGGIPGLGTQSSFNKMWDNRYVQVYQAARGR